MAPLPNPTPWRKRLKGPRQDDLNAEQRARLASPARRTRPAITLPKLQCLEKPLIDDDREPR
jgi:hypothetical protein